MKVAAVGVNSYVYDTKSSYNEFWVKFTKIAESSLFLKFDAPYCSNEIEITDWCMSSTTND